MSFPAFARPALPVWVRVAAFFSFLAILAALAAPLSVLAQEVRSGQLSGICSLNSPENASINAGNGPGNGAPHAGAHCELCASPGGAWLPMALVPGLWLAGRPQAVAPFPVVAGAAVAGLPFSRGPPAL